MSEDLYQKSPETDESVIEYLKMKPGVFSDIFGNPINIFLLTVCLYLLYRILKTDGVNSEDNVPEPLSPIKKRDFTVKELRKYNGIKNEQILIAVNGRVFDVTKGKRFYGPGNPYGMMAGRDASRSFGKFSTDEDLFKDEWDDISDLTAAQMDAVRDWEKQFEEKYDFVGRLLKPGEEHSTYESLEKNKEL